MAGHDGHGTGGEFGEADVAEMFSEAFWDERYRTRDALWSRNPNPYLVREAAGLSPGRALDAGCGEGADAIWLAQRGWQVTGVDISTVALDRAREHARAAGPRIAAHTEWRPVDLFGWEPGKDEYELVSAQYLHFPAGSRDVTFGRLAAAVRPGGTLLIVGHHPSDIGIMPRPPIPDLFFTGDEVAALLSPAGWDVVTNAAPGREVPHPEDGRMVTVHETVLRAQRHH